MDDDENVSNIPSEPSTSSGLARKSSRPPAVRVLDSSSRYFQDELFDLLNETIQDEIDEDVDDSDQDPDYPDWSRSSAKHQEDPTN